MQNNRKTSLLSLYLTFFRIGLMTFGGGYAILPILQKEIVEKNAWCNEDEILDYFAVGQCTPGIIAVNTSTFVGYKCRGILGGIIATLGFVTPSIIIIIALASVLASCKDRPLIMHAFAGVRVAVCALITTSVIKLAKKSLVDVPTIILSALTLVLMVAFSPSPIIFVAVGIIWGLVFSALKEHRRSKKTSC